MSELLPCPFCGATPMAVTGYGLWIACDGCGAFGPTGDNPGDKRGVAAIAAWNRRPLAEADLARVSEERDRLLGALGYLVNGVRNNGNSLDVFPMGDSGWLNAAGVYDRAIASARQSPPSTVGQPGDGAAGGEG